MKRNALYLILLIMLALVPMSAGSSSGPEQILWDDLIPQTEPLDDPLEDVSWEARETLAEIARVASDLALGFVEADGPEVKEAEEQKATLKEQGIDFDALERQLDVFEAEIERRNQLMVEDLDGRTVRIPGYALPLEHSDLGVKEFLLVPYIGACIHVPPPPPNQIVYVELNQSYISTSLYDPVWITGEIRVQPGSRSLSFVDGRADIATGYTIKASNIEPYE